MRHCSANQGLSGAAGLGERLHQRSPLQNLGSLTDHLRAMALKKTLAFLSPFCTKTAQSLLLVASCRAIAVPKQPFNLYAKPLFSAVLSIAN